MSLEAFKMDGTMNTRQLLEQADQQLVLCAWCERPLSDEDASMRLCADCADAQLRLSDDVEQTDKYDMQMDLEEDESYTGEDELDENFDDDSSYDSYNHYDPDWLNAH